MKIWAAGVWKHRKLLKEILGGKICRWSVVTIGIFDSKIFWGPLQCNQSTGIHNEILSDEFWRELQHLQVLLSSSATE